MNLMYIINFKLFLNSHPFGEKNAHLSLTFPGNLHTYIKKLFEAVVDSVPW
jgi:hypothetical protein